MERCMSTRIGRAALLPLPLLLVVASTAACTHTTRVPRALSAARAEVARAENGPAGSLQTAAVGDAEAALADAEAAYKENNEDAELRAVYAQRKAQLAESLAATEVAHKRAHDAIAERNLLLDVRSAEARVIAERNGQTPPATGAAEMQPQTTTQKTQKTQQQATPASSARAPGSNPPAAPQSGATKAH
jgi:hypothetical protein